MLESIYSYVEKIVIFGILVTIISKVLPSKKYEKYVKLYTGFLFLFLLFFPIIKVTGIDKHWFEFYQSYEANLNYDGLETDTKEKLYQKYEETLGSQITKVLKEQGYQVAAVEVKTDAKAEGEVQSVFVTLQGTEEEEMVPAININPVEIHAVEETKDQEEEQQEHSQEAEEIIGIIQTICSQDGEAISVEVRE